MCHLGLSFDIVSDDIVAVDAWDQPLPGLCSTYIVPRLLDCTLPFALPQEVSAEMILSEA